MFDYLKKKINDAVQVVVPVFVQPSKEKQFALNGTLIPQQFYEGGDNLTKACKAWKWQKADPGMQHKFLKDPERQFLMIEKVNCKSRVKDLLGKTSFEMEKNEEGEQVVVIQSHEEEKKPQKAEEVGDFQFQNDEAARFYKLYITYDPYYHTPRMWFSATDSDGKPITNQQIYDDVVDQYKEKTLTVQNFPHLKDLRMPTVHPCKHANVLKEMSKTLDVGKGSIDARSSMFIFLKFVSSIIPTVEYDIAGQLHMTA